MVEGGGGEWGLEGEGEDDCRKEIGGGRRGVLKFEEVVCRC